MAEDEPEQNAAGESPTDTPDDYSKEERDDEDPSSREPQALADLSVSRFFKQIRVKTHDEQLKKV